MTLSRRTVLQIGMTALATPALAQNTRPRVVVIGGGFAGASAARALAVRDLETVLIEPASLYTACPMSNAVIGGFRQIAQQQFGYDKLAAAGVKVVAQSATTIDHTKREVHMADGQRIPFQRLIVAPGIDFNNGALPGYSDAAAELMPHAWKAGSQTLLLRRQLEAMPDGGRVGMVIPANPYRCPPGPYERASLIAWYLKNHKPKSKLILLDAKDSFSKQRLFQAAWERLYPGMIEWVPLSKGGKAVEVQPQDQTIVTEFGREKFDVTNVIPPQYAGRIAERSGLTDRSGWCPIQADNFESTLRTGIHIIGDAAIMGAMPKSAFSAHAQAQACAAAIAASLRGAESPAFKLINACYSLTAPEEAISITGVYQPRDGRLVDVEGAGGISALNLSDGERALEARYALDWYNRVTQQTYG